MFMHDVASGHFSADAREYLNHTFNLWLGRG